MFIVADLVSLMNKQRARLMTYSPVHKILVHITLASNEGSSKSAHIYPDSEPLLLAYTKYVCRWRLWLKFRPLGWICQHGHLLEAFAHIFFIYFLFGLLLNVPVNSYGHAGTVSVPDFDSIMKCIHNNITYIWQNLDVFTPKPDYKFNWLKCHMINRI